MKVISVDVAKEHVMTNYPNDPILRTMAITLLDNLPNFEFDQHDARVRELEDQIAQMNAENEWKLFGKLKPPKSGRYLCTVLRPVHGGNFSKEAQVIFWEGDFGGGWDCEGMIVTHFQALRTLPENELYG